MSQVGSIDDSATAYRVRLDDGTVALDWTPTLPDGDGLYTVRLYRNGNPSLPLLGDHTGKMWVDVRFKDLQGDETVDYRVLAEPSAGRAARGPGTRDG